MRACSILVFVLLISIPAAAQTRTTDDLVAQKEAATLWLQAGLLESKARMYALDPENHKEDSGAAEELAAIYRKAVNYSGNSASFSGEIYARFLASKALADSAPQVSQVADEASVKLQFLIAAQNQVLIEQNKKIIDLLGQIARKK